MHAKHQKASLPEITRAAFRTVTDAARPPKTASRFIAFKAGSLILSPAYSFRRGLLRCGILARPSSASGDQLPPTFVPGDDRCSPEGGRQGGAFSHSLGHGAKHISGRGHCPNG